MKSERFIENEFITMIEVSSDFDTREDMLMGDLIKGIRNKKIGFTVKEIQYSFYKLPILILGDKDDVINLKLNDYSEKAIRKEIEINNFRNIPLTANNEILSNYKFTLNFKSNNPESLKFDFNDKVFTGGSLFKVIDFGSYLIIFPNLSCMYFNADELKNAKKGDDYYKVLKKTLIKKASFRAELRKRREDLREYMFSVLKNIGNNYSSKNLTALIYDGFLSSGIYISFMDEQYVKNVHEDLVLPFKVDEKENKLILKTQEEIDKDIKSRVSNIV